MNELTTIRKILERFAKYLTKKEGLYLSILGHKTLQPYGGKCAQSKSGHHHYIAAEHKKIPCNQSATGYFALQTKY